ncbi:MAG: HD domain-containing protein [bacterium]|nr:HD domain-containing protein [bacterium]
MAEMSASEMGLTPAELGLAETEKDATADSQSEVAEQDNKKQPEVEADEQEILAQLEPLFAEWTQEEQRSYLEFWINSNGIVLYELKKLFSDPQKLKQAHQLANAKIEQLFTQRFLVLDDNINRRADELGQVFRYDFDNSEILTALAPQAQKLLTQLTQTFLQNLNEEATDYRRFPVFYVRSLMKAFPLNAEMQNQLQTQLQNLVAEALQIVDQVRAAGNLSEEEENAQGEIVTEKLEKAKKIIDSFNLVWQPLPQKAADLFICDGYLETVFAHHEDAFASQPLNQEFAMQILEDAREYGDEKSMADLAENLSSFPEESLGEDIAKILIEEGYALAVFKNLAIFTQAWQTETDGPFLEKIVQDYQDYQKNDDGSAFSSFRNDTDIRFDAGKILKFVAENLDTADTGELSSGMAQKLIKRGCAEAVLEHAEVFKDFQFDQNLAQALLENREKETLVKYLEKFPAQSLNSEIARQLIFDIYNFKIEINFLDGVSQHQEIFQNFELKNFLTEQIKIGLSLEEINILQKQFRKLREKYSLEQLSERGIDVEELTHLINESLAKSIEVIPVPLTAQKEFFRALMAKNTGNEQMLLKMDFSQFDRQTGLPLKFTRAQFLSALNEINVTLSPEEQTAFWQKITITPRVDGAGKIVGYEGIPTLKNLDLQESTTNAPEQKFAQIFQQFFLENAVQTGHQEFDNFMNAIIAAVPEFINIIGKLQHSEQEHTLDIHTLRVLQAALEDKENYDQLGNLDKFSLKLAILFHDIAKKEGVTDQGHERISALYARNLLEKFKLSSLVRSKIFEQIANHQWLKEYSAAKAEEAVADDLLKTEMRFGQHLPAAQVVAARFRRQQDYLMAKIFARADLKGVNESFYQTYKQSLSDAEQQPIAEALREDQETGIPLFTDSSRLSFQDLPATETIKGKQYRVLNLSAEANPAELAQFGFIEGKNEAGEIIGSQAEDLRFLIHFLPNDDLRHRANIAQNASDIAHGGSLSSSLVRLGDKNSQLSYGGRRFGLLLETQPENLAVAANRNLDSGVGKDFETFARLRYRKESGRIYVRQYFLQALEQPVAADQLGVALTEEEYGELFKQLMHKSSLAQIADESIFKVGEKSLTGKQIKMALRQARDSLFRQKGYVNNNEVVAYNPQVKAIVGLTNNMQEFAAQAPELLTYAQEHDLPIYLMGNS